MTSRKDAAPQDDSTMRVPKILPSATLSETFRLPLWLEVILGLVVLLELIAPFITTPSGPDGPIHVYWIEKYNLLLRVGVFPPHWLPSAFRGFGSPTFYYYPPLSFLLAGAISFATGITDANVLYQSVVILSTALSVLGMWKLLAWLGATRYRALIGSVIYAFAPYRIAEIYSRSSLSSILGYAWVPFICLGLLWICSDRKHLQPHGIAVASIAMSLEILSSIPMAMIIGVIGVFVVFLTHRYIFGRALAFMGITAMLTIALDAFFLLPMIEFRDAIHLSNATGDPEFALLDLFKMTGMPGVFHSALIYVAIVLFVISYFVIVRNKNVGTFAERLTIRVACSISLLILLLDLPISVPVWRHVPIFSLIQGPWRFYICVVFLFATLIGIVQTPKLQRLIVGTISIWTLCALLPILLLIFNFHLYTHHVTVDVDPAGFLPASATDPVFASNNPERFLPILEHLSPLPCIIEAPPLTTQEHCKCTSFGATTEMYDVSLLTQHVATFHRFQWPAWYLYVDGRQIGSRPDSMGRATAILPAGQYTATWQLERSPLERDGIWISIFTAMGILLFFAGRYGKKIVGKRGLK